MSDNKDLENDKAYWERYGKLIKRDKDYWNIYKEIDENIYNILEKFENERQKRELDISLEDLCNAFLFSTERNIAVFKYKGDKK